MNFLDSFIQIPVSDSTDAVIEIDTLESTPGVFRLRALPSYETAGFLFSRAIWTSETAKKWISSHEYTVTDNKGMFDKFLSIATSSQEINSKTPLDISTYLNGAGVHSVFDAKTFARLGYIFSSAYWTQATATRFITDYQSETVAKTFQTTRTLKTIDPSERLFGGVAYPASEIDLHKDFMTPEEVKKMAHSFLTSYRAQKAIIDRQHSREEVSGVDVVESHISRVDIPELKIKTGDWVVVCKALDDATWAAVEAGEINAFSFDCDVIAIEREVPEVME